MTKVFIAGHKGMVGSAIHRQLADDPGCKIITADRRELDLLCQKSVREFFEEHRFDHVYLAAAKVGGIHANNTYPAEFIYENLVMQTNVIDASYKSGVERLLFLGSSCIYPKLAKQPMSELALLTGPLEPTNEAYAIAKIAGLKLCESYRRQYGCDYRAVMPTNLYGPHDNFDLENSHVIPALIRKFHAATTGGLSEVVVWGTGKIRREFLHVDDLAKSCVSIMRIHHQSFQSRVTASVSHVNIGSGTDVTILELVKMLKEISGFKGEVIWDSSKPDGTPRKLLDVSLMHALGIKSTIALREGLKSSYQWYVEHEDGRERNAT